MRTVLKCWGVATVVLVGSVGCSSDDDDAGGPRIVVTTNILGDVVEQVAGGSGADIQVVMPLGADPHEFAPSSRQAEAMVDADLLVINGAHFEEGMESIIEQAEEDGTPVFAVADHVELLPYSGPEGDEHADEEDEEEHADEEDEHAEDPHVWTDPARIAEALPALGDALAEVEGIDTDAVEQGVAAYAAELTQLDQDIEAALADIPEERRVLVTNHEVFGYFADRYGFEIIGTIIPSGTTLAEPSSAELEDLADAIRDHGVTAVFGETTESTRLADALAASVGSEVEVVELYTESLGEEGSGAETYVGLMNTDAELIAGALAPR